MNQLATYPLLPLTATDWYLATWRPLDPLPLTPPPPFDWENLKKRYKEVMKTKYPHWQNAGLTPNMGRREAHFWLEMMIIRAQVARRRRRAYPQIEKISPNRFTGEMDWTYVQRELTDGRWWYSDLLIIPLVRLFPLTDLVTFLYRGTHFSPFTHNILFTYRWQQSILPYLPPAEKEQLQQAIRDELATLSLPWLTPGSKHKPDLFVFAAYLGLHDELYQGVTNWPDETFGRNPHRTKKAIAQRPQDIILGLGHPDLVVEQMKRLNLPLRTAKHIRGWLAHTEMAHLDYIRDSILSDRSPTRAQKLCHILGQIETPETAAYMLEIMNDATIPQKAQAWLGQRPLLAITGIAPLAAQRGKLAETAQMYLRGLARDGYKEAILAQIDDKLADRLFQEAHDLGKTPFTEANTPDWLRQGVALGFKQWGTKPPAWVGPNSLPPIVVGEHILNDTQVTAVLLAIRQSLSYKMPPFLVDLKKQADPHTLDEFVWQLLELWEYGGGRKQESWAFQGISFLGSNALAIKLNQMVREWAEKKKTAWVEWGVDCLQKMNSDGAILQLFHLQHTLSRQRLRQLVAKRITAVAQARHLTESELADRIVPDCDLDQNGQRRFDYGSRQFHFVMGPEMTPFLRDETGKLLKNLPRPRVSDDPHRAKRARANWQTFKKKIRDAVKIQSVHLEQAMIYERRWSWAEFNEYFLHHPLMRHFSQFLVWGLYSAENSLEETFRVTADFTFADINDDSTTPTLTPTAPQPTPVSYTPALLHRPRPTKSKLLDFLQQFIEAPTTDSKPEPVSHTPHEPHQVGLVHPLHLTPSQRAAWAEILHDYEIIPPFPQIGRQLYDLSVDEKRFKTITRFDSAATHVLSLHSRLHKRDWHPGRWRGTNFYTRYFPQIKGTAVAEVATIWENRRATQNQKLAQCYVVVGHIERQRPHDMKRIPLAKLNPVVLSEILYDLTIATAT